MTTSQTDVDKVMAAFGAAPIAYRPSQELSSAEIRAAANRAPATAQSDATERPAERVLPGAGGRVREIFPLLWRAIPVVGDFKINSIRRAGDEVPVSPDPETADDRALAARLRAVLAVPAAPSSPVLVATRAEPPETAPLPAPVVVAPPHVPPTPVQVQAAPPPPPVVPAPVIPLAPLRSHAELIRPVGARAPEAPQSAPASPPFEQGAPSHPIPGPMSTPPVTATPQAWPPQPAAPQPGPAYPEFGRPPAPPPGIPYPPYYPYPQPSLPQGMLPYPPQPPGMGMHPPGAYPFGVPAPGYPAYVNAYPPPYPPHPSAYPPPYPYGYPQPLSGYGSGPPTLYPDAPAASAVPPVPVSLPATAPAPTNLSDVFAALQRAPGTARKEGT